MSKVRYAVVGSGWRSLFYIRIAKALPETFELTALLCRTREKADRFKMTHIFYTGGIKEHDSDQNRNHR